MEINLTLLGQMITFAVFVWFTMKYIWPPITKAMQDRQTRIAEGLAASDKGKKSLELAEHRSVKILQSARLDASQLLEKANKRAAEIIEKAKADARIESDNILAHAQTDIKQARASVIEDLRKEVSTLSMLGAEKILQREIDPTAHEKMLSRLTEQLS
jgi:F-type H+-transporting ATPase subunit b